ncbi:MAG TPA: acyl-CoA dehydrogenase family protein [Steroidobacteraceae bacterium]
MPVTAQSLLSHARELAARAADRAVESEVARTLAPDLVAALREIGIFRMFVPRSHGGLELEFPETLPIIEALACGDGAIGWTAMIGSHLPLFAAPLPRRSFDQLYSNGPDLIGAGAAVPAGRAEVTEGGFVVSGRWPFASGCRHADYIFGFCVAMNEAEPVAGPADGAPSLRAVLVPAGAWGIEDTWYAAGLKGTGSHHVTLSNVRVPEEMTYDILTTKSNIAGPLYCAGPFFLLALHVGAVAVGVAEGAIRDLVANANSGRRQLRARMDLRDNPLLQHELGRADADVRAARAFLYSQCESYWHTATAGKIIDFAAGAAGLQALAWITATCARATDLCYTLGGGVALYESSPLQRRLRDIHAVTQHSFTHLRRFGGVGRLRLGFPAVHPLLDG